MVPGPSSTNETQHNNLAPWRVLPGGVSHWIDVIISQSKNAVSFVPSNNNNNTTGGLTFASWVTSLNSRKGYL